MLTWTRNIEQISKVEGLDVEKVRSAKYLFEWDRYVQCPTWGYPTEHAYYRDASSVDAVLNIRVPTLALHARDDPICGDISVPYQNFKQNPYTLLCATSSGGHLGWFEFGGGRWYTTVVSCSKSMTQKFV
jgi:predicted alpha/beta-fold hydrolase